LINRARKAFCYLAFARNSKTCPCEVDADQQDSTADDLSNRTQKLNAIRSNLIMDFEQFFGLELISPNAPVVSPDP
jgi:hypothetical protein